MSVAKTRLLPLVLVLLVACPAFTIRVAAQPVWSADGRHLYFEGVVYERDGETGALTAKQRLAAEGAARVLAASPDGTNAYGQEDEHDPVGIHTWRRDPATGLHTLEQEIPDVTVTSIAVSPDGRNLYAGARDEQVLVFDRDQNRGALTPIGSAGVLGRVVYLVFDPGGQHLYVGSVVEGTRPALPRSRLVHFLRDRVTGALSAGDLVELPHPHLAAQNGPRAIMDPDGSIFYDVRSLIRTYVAARDPIDGTLTWLETLSRGVSAMSPDGLHLYGTFGRRIQRMLSQDLLREPEDLALLPPVTRFPPAALSMSPDGRHLYATEARGDAVRVLQRDASSGGLSDLAVAACTVVGTGAVNVRLDRMQESLKNSCGGSGKPFHRWVIRRVRRAKRSLQKALRAARRARPERVNAWRMRSIKELDPIPKRAAREARSKKKRRRVPPGCPANAIREIDLAVRLLSRYSFSRGTLVSCDRNAVCVNPETEVSCECSSGFEGDGFVCFDIDECAVSEPCDPNAECVNANGTFHCLCRPGFEGDGFACVPPDGGAVESAVFLNRPSDLSGTR